MIYILLMAAAANAIFAWADGDAIEVLAWLTVCGLLFIDIRKEKQSEQPRQNEKTDKNS